MKEFELEFKLIQSAPADRITDIAFTEHIMQNLNQPSLAKEVKNAVHPNKRTLLYRLRHLPKFAVVLIAIAVLFTISGVTYAVVETVKKANENVKVEQTGTNSFGREQLTVTFDSCAEEKKAGTTYELKKNSGLSAEDGANVLQARCDLDFIDSWIEKDPQASSKFKQTHAIASMQGIPGKVEGTPDTNITLNMSAAFTNQKYSQTFPFSQGARVIEEGKEVDRSSLKPGDTVLYVSPRMGMRDESAIPGDAIIAFKLKLDPKYYKLDMRSYVSARSACQGNPARSCFQHNSINTVNLAVTRGGAWSNPKSVSDGVTAIKTIQGKMVSWDANAIKLDVGDGVIYTIKTPSNVIDTYNHTTVYGLKTFDNIYASTDPEALKMTTGDNLEIAYQENKDQSSQTLEWSQTLTISLMVERTIKDINVLQKY